MGKSLTTQPPQTIFMKVNLFQFAYCLYDINAIYTGTGGFFNLSQDEHVLFSLLNFNLKVWKRYVLK